MFWIWTPSTEFSYFINNVEFDPERDLKIMKIYYEELIKTVKPEEYPWEVFQREVEIRNIQIVINTFNFFFKYSPESIKKMAVIFEKRGIKLDELLKQFRTKFMRFAYIFQKWERENILDRMEEF